MGVPNSPTFFLRQRHIATVINTMSYMLNALLLLDVVADLKQILHALRVANCGNHQPSFPEKLSMEGQEPTLRLTILR